MARRDPERRHTFCRRKRSIPWRDGVYRSSRPEKSLLSQPRLSEGSWSRVVLKRRSLHLMNNSMLKITRLLKKLPAVQRVWCLKQKCRRGPDRRNPEAYKKMSAEDLIVAVRSSATAEDLPDASFAGQQETYLNIKGETNLF